jgi:hypothetical protein
MADDFLKKYWQNRNQEVQQDRKMIQPQQIQSKPAEVRTVSLKEGHTYFAQVKTNGFGGTENLAKVVGVISGAASKNVILKQSRTFYLMDDSQVFDMGKLSSKTPITLFEVEIPLVGLFFVTQESIISNTGKQILKG